VLNKYATTTNACFKVGIVYNNDLKFKSSRCKIIEYRWGTFLLSSPFFSSITQTTFHPNMQVKTIGTWCKKLSCIPHDNENDGIPWCLH
jgi:hypothetical protein